MELYFLELQKLAMRLLKMIGKALGVSEEEIEEQFEDGMQSVRLSYYPPCPQPELVMGLGPHSDATAITILMQVNGVDGLQVKKKWCLGSYESSPRCLCNERRRHSRGFLSCWPSLSFSPTHTIKHGEEI